LDLFDLIIKILSKGYNVLYASPETIFKSNPLPILNPIVDIQAQSDGGDTISYEFSFLYSSSSVSFLFLDLFTLFYLFIFNSFNN